MLRPLARVFGTQSYQTRTNLALHVFIDCSELAKNNSLPSPAKISPLLLTVASKHWLAVVFLSEEGLLMSFLTGYDVSIVTTYNELRACVCLGQPFSFIPSLSI